MRSPTFEKELPCGESMTLIMIVHQLDISRSVIYSSVPRTVIDPNYERFWMEVVCLKKRFIMCIWNAICMTRPSKIWTQRHNALRASLTQLRWNRCKSSFIESTRAGDVLKQHILKWQTSQLCIKGRYPQAAKIQAIVCSRLYCPSDMPNKGTLGYLEKMDQGIRDTGQLRNANNSFTTPVGKEYCIHDWSWTIFCARVCLREPLPEP